MKRGNKLLTMTKMVLLLLALTLPLSLQEQVSAASQDYSITIALKDLGTSRNAVTLKAYKVASWDGRKWNLDAALQTAGISLEDLNSASDWNEAAANLAAQKGIASLTGVSATTNEYGNAVLSNLQEGMYLVIHTEGKKYGTIAPFFAELPYEEAGVQQKNLNVSPKAEKPDSKIEASGSGTVAGEEKSSQIENQTEAKESQVIEPQTKALQQEIKSAETGKEKGVHLPTEAMTEAETENEQIGSEEPKETMSESTEESEETQEPEVEPEEHSESGPMPVIVAAVTTAVAVPTAAVGVVRFRGGKKHGK